MKVGIVQVMAGYNKDENVARTAEMVARAADRGAEVVALPEMFCCPMEHRYYREFAEEQGGGVYQSLSAMAKRHGVYLVGGTIPEYRDGKLYNTSYTFSPDGREVHCHSKRKLFDITLPDGREFKESNTFTAGDSAPTAFPTPLGTFGLAICFEIRFAEDFYALERQGAKVVFVPANFSYQTGKVHWELLFRSRALDTQSFFVGISGARNAESKFKSYAHSIVTDAWGDVVWQAGSEECVEVLDLDMERNEKVRREIPVSYNRNANFNKM